VWKGHRSTDKRYAGDNRLMTPKSSYRRRCLAPRCRLIASWGWSRSQGFGCSPIKVVRELGLERRETVRSLSAVGVRDLRGSVPSTRGPGWTYLWWTGIVTAAVYWGFDSKLSPLLLTFQHRAGVRPHTSSCDFAEPYVFSKQSPPPSLCPRPLVAQRPGPLIPKLRGQFAEFLQRSSLKRLGMLYQSTCVGLGYGLKLGLFPGTRSLPSQSM